MATKPLPAQDVLLQLLSYDPETGKLFWKERGREWFKTNRSHSTWNARFAGQPAFDVVDSEGYPSGVVLYHRCRAHRIIWKMQTGKDPVGVDHVDGAQHNNRWANLREADQHKNMKNMKMNVTNTSGVMGVVFAKNRGKWVARIRTNGVVISLGSYANFDDAVAARKAAEKKYGFHKNHGRA